MNLVQCVKKKLSIRYINYATLYCILATCSASPAVVAVSLVLI